MRKIILVPIVVGVIASSIAMFNEKDDDLGTTYVYAEENNSVNLPTYNANTTDVSETEKKLGTYKYTDYEINLISLVTMAEAEGECENGKRLVIDTIFNRVDSKYFPNTVNNVIYQRNQFSCMWNGRINRCYVKDDIRKLVIEEMKNRLNYDVMFFNSVGYTPYGQPLFKVGNHYFSKYVER